MYLLPGMEFGCMAVPGLPWLAPWLVLGYLASLVLRLSSHRTGTRSQARVQRVRVNIHERGGPA